MKKKENEKQEEMILTASVYENEQKKSCEECVRWKFRNREQEKQKGLKSAAILTRINTRSFCNA